MIKHYLGSTLILDSAIYDIPVQSYNHSNSTTIETKHSRKTHLNFEFSIHYNVNYVHSNGRNIRKKRD